TAQRLPSLLEWEEWGSHGRTAAIPPLLCHGTGDAITVPAPAPTVPTPPSTGRSTGPGRSAPTAPTGPDPSDSRWLVAPDTRHPWLPGPEILLWAAVRAARSAVRISIFPPPDQGANVYDVSRRR
ncbi:hypothetical protein ACTWQJ_42115, partial [Streptomyces sp. KR55]